MISEVQNSPIGSFSRFWFHIGSSNRMAFFLLEQRPSNGNVPCAILLDPRLWRKMLSWSQNRTLIGGDEIVDSSQSLGLDMMPTINGIFISSEKRENCALFCIQKMVISLISWWLGWFCSEWRWLELQTTVVCWNFTCKKILLTHGNNV